MGDLAVAGGRVIDPGEADGRFEEIDAAGMWLMPGLIDFHLHFFNTGTEIGLPVDVFCPASGVTTAVDAGSAGAVTYPAFHSAVQGGITRAFALLNVCPTGLPSLRMHECLNPALLLTEPVRSVFARYPESLRGLKIRVSKELVKNYGLQPLRRAVEIAGELQVPVVVHSTNPPDQMERVLALLRPGDVLAHAFHGVGHTLFENGHISPCALEARKRGVLFDACHGRTHYTFANLEAAMGEGFFPDIISSDATLSSAFHFPLGGLPMILSYYLSLGADPLALLRACTSAPAAFLRLGAEAPSLQIGSCADLVLLNPAKRKIRFQDCTGQERFGRTTLIPQLTLRAGQIVYRSYASYK